MAGDGTWQVTVWRPQGWFMYAFWVNDAYYVHQSGVGLMRLVNDEFEVLPGSEIFADERLHVMLPFDDAGRILVGPWNQGLFLFDGQSFQPFATDALLAPARSTKGSCCRTARSASRPSSEAS